MDNYLIEKISDYSIEAYFAKLQPSSTDTTLQLSFVILAHSRQDAESKS